MTWLAETLWDLLRRGERRRGGNRPKSGKDEYVSSANQKIHSRPVLVVENIKAKANRPMQSRYDALVVEMKSRYQVRVRKWRNSSSGCAWEVHYHSGGVTRLIESPYPRGPMSCAIFLHEIGHHAIGFGRWRPRCLEEFKAWEWSLATMRERGFNVTPAVEKRVDSSMKYAVAKAIRRGIRNLPADLLPFLPESSCR